MKKRMIRKLEKASVRLTDWVGTPISIVVHTIFFAGIFLLTLVGVSFDSILLLLTTAVSLEAIYLAIFIQMSVNRNTKSIQVVEEQVEDIAEDVEDIAEDVGGIEEDVDEISKDVDSIKEDVDDLGDDVTELTTDAKDDSNSTEHMLKGIQAIESHLHTLQNDLITLRKKVEERSRH